MMPVPENPSSVDSSANAEYVVKPPSTPVIKNSRAVSAPPTRLTIHIYKSPIAKLPSRFTVIVGTGNPPGVVGHSLPTPYRAMLPNAPPIATHNQLTALLPLPSCRHAVAPAPR